MYTVVYQKIVIVPMYTVVYQKIVIVPMYTDSCLSEKHITTKPTEIHTY
jgi:hypothetical protein